MEVPYHEDKEGHDGGEFGKAISEVRRAGEISSIGGVDWCYPSKLMVMTMRRCAGVD